MNSLLKVSERQHSGLILMAELALAQQPLTLKSIAERMHISEGYLEEIAHALKAASLIKGRKGPKGGYVLAKPAKEVTMEAIVTALEGPIVMVDCQASPQGCPVSHTCKSKNMWNFLRSSLTMSLRSTSLADIAK